VDIILGEAGMSSSQRQTLAQELLEILRTQPSDDIEKLREFAKRARGLGCNDLAIQAEEFAELFELDDEYMSIKEQGLSQGLKDAKAIIAKAEGKE
jgi:hypothetical protein